MRDRRLYLKFEFRYACLRLEFNPIVILAKSQALSVTNAKYSYTQTIVKQMTVPSGGTSFTYDNVFQGIWPDLITVGFAKSTGVYGENPRFFQDYNATRIAVMWMGYP